MKLTLLLCSILLSLTSYSFNSSKNVNLYCRGKKLPLAARLNTVKLSLSVLETGTNAIALDYFNSELMRFAFEEDSYSYNSGNMNSMYTASFDRISYLNDMVLGYELFGSVNLSGDRDYDIEKLYEIHSFDQSIEAYRQDGDDLTIVEIKPYGVSGYNFKMMLDGEIYGNYAGEYAVNCFIGTYK